MLSNASLNTGKPTGMHAITYQMTRKTPVNQSVLEKLSTAIPVINKINEIIAGRNSRNLLFFHDFTPYIVIGYKDRVSFVQLSCKFSALPEKRRSTCFLLSEKAYICDRKLREKKVTMI